MYMWDKLLHTFHDNVYTVYKLRLFTEGVEPTLCSSGHTAVPYGLQQVSRAGSCTSKVLFCMCSKRTFMSTKLLLLCTVLTILPTS